MSETSLRESHARLLEAAETALAGIDDWRLGSDVVDVDDMRYLRASEGYLGHVRHTLREAIAAAAEVEQDHPASDRKAGDQ